MQILDGAKEPHARVGDCLLDARPHRPGLLAVDLVSEETRVRELALFLVEPARVERAVGEEGVAQDCKESSEGPCEGERVGLDAGLCLIPTLYHKEPLPTRHAQLAVQGKDGSGNEARKGRRGNVGAIHDSNAGGDFCARVKARDDEDGAGVWEISRFRREIEGSRAVSI
jgi:hypothetical protein